LVAAGSFSEATGRRPRLTKEINVLYFISFLFLFFFFFFYSHLLWQVESGVAPLLSLELLARGPPLVYHFAPLSVLTDTHAQTQSRSTASTPTFSDAFFSQFRKPFYFSFRYIFNLFLFLHYLSLSLYLGSPVLFPCVLRAAVMATMKAMPSHAIGSSEELGIRMRLGAEPTKS
jgi:hypothetical protein